MSSMLDIVEAGTDAIISVEVINPDEPFGGVLVPIPRQTPVQVSLNSNGASLVSSVFGRVGAITAQQSDYAAFYAPLGSVGAVSSVFGRSGAVVAQEADYDAFYPNKAVVYDDPSWIGLLSWSKITGSPTTLAGYGITDPVVLSSGSYADPSWITSLAWSKITGAPAFEQPLTFFDSLSRSGNNVSLANDLLLPGNNMFYGTNASGTRGWFAMPGATPAEPPLGNPTTNGEILSSTIAGVRSWVPAGEPALGNPSANGYILSSTSAGVRSWIAPPTGGTPAGANTQIQFNNNGVFGASANLAFNTATNILNAQLLQLANGAATNGAQAIFFSDQLTGIYRGSGGIGNFLGITMNGVKLIVGGNYTVSSVPMGFAASIPAGGAGPDVALGRNGVGIAEINNGTAGAFADLKLHNLILSGSITPAVEPALGNPSTDGYVLSSTAAGVRSWIAPSGGGGGVTWPLLAPAGTFSAPSYSFSALASTGLYQGSGGGGGIGVAVAGVNTGFFFSSHFSLGGAAGMYLWTNSANPQSGWDTGMARNAAGVVEINNATKGTFADLKLRTLFLGLQATAPSPPVEGMVYASSTNHVIYYYNGTAWVDLTLGGGGGAVASVFGRTGAVVAVAGDYASFYEASLGNPTVNGYVLSSNTAGLRNWIPIPASEPPLGNPSTDNSVLVSTAAGVRSWLAPTGTGSNVLSANPTFTGTLNCANLNCTGTFLRPNAIQGTNTNDAAVSGNVGETVTAAKPSAASAAMGANAIVNVVSITVPAGDWDIRGIVSWSGSIAANSASVLTAAVTTTTTTLPDDGWYGMCPCTNPTATAQTGFGSVTIPPRRFSFAAGTIVYLCARGGVAGSGWGAIEARRIR